MSPSVPRRRQPGRTSRPSRGRSSRVLVIWSALVVTAVWSIATGAYFAFRGDAIHSMTEMQATYDKRISDLRGEFGRVVSQQFLDQERIQHQLNVLLQQQATLEQHKSALPDDQLATGSISAKAPRFRHHSQRTACCGTFLRHRSIDTEISECSPPPQTACSTSDGSATTATTCSRCVAVGSRPT